MRTAEEILRENFAWFPDALFPDNLYDKFVKQCISMINETRKEVIEECAEMVDNAIKNDFSINKPTILKLKDQLK